MILIHAHNTEIKNIIPRVITKLIQSTLSWKISRIYPGEPARGEAQNGQTAWNPFVPCGIGTLAQYLETIFCNLFIFYKQQIFKKMLEHTDKINLKNPVQKELL